MKISYQSLTKWTLLGEMDPVGLDEQLADALRQLEAREQSLRAVRAESDAVNASVRLTEQRFAFGAADRTELLAVHLQALQLDFEQAAEQARKLSDAVLYIQSIGGAVPANNEKK